MWRWPLLYHPSKGVSVDKQAHDNIVDLLGFGEADRFTDQAFDARPQGQMLALDVLRVMFARLCDDQRHTPRQPLCDDQSRATANADGLSCQQNSTFHPSRLRQLAPCPRPSRPCLCCAAKPY